MGGFSGAVGCGEGAADAGRSGDRAAARVAARGGSRCGCAVVWNPDVGPLGGRCGAKSAVGGAEVRNARFAGHGFIGLDSAGKRHPRSNFAATRHG